MDSRGNDADVVCFIKALNKQGLCFHYVANKFPKISNEKFMVEFSTVQKLEL